MSKCEYFSNMNEIDNEDFLWNNNYVSEKSEKKEFDYNSSIDFLDSTDIEVEFGHFEKKNNISREITTTTSVNVDFNNKSTNKDSNHIQELLHNTQLGNKTSNNDTNMSLKNLHSSMEIVETVQHEFNNNFKNCNLSSNNTCQYKNMVNENHNYINTTTTYQEEEEKIFNFKKESLKSLEKDLDFDSKEEFEFNKTNNSKLSNTTIDKQNVIVNEMDDTKIEKNKSNINTSFLGDESNESLYTIKSRDLNTSIEFTEKYLKQVKKDLEKGIKRKLKKEVKKEIAKGLEKAQSMTNLNDATADKEINIQKKIKEELRNQIIQLINMSSNETTLLRSILKLIMETDDVEKYCIFNNSFKTNKEDIDAENNKIDKSNECIKKNTNIINRNKMPFVPILNKKSRNEDNISMPRSVKSDGFINNNSSDINKIELVSDKLSSGVNNTIKTYKKVPQNSTVELINNKIPVENNGEKLQTNQCKSDNIDPFESFNNDTCTSIQSKILSDSEDNMSIDIYEEHPEEAKSVFGSLFNMIIRKKEVKDDSTPEIKIFKKKEMEIPTGERIINSNAYAGKKKVDVKIPQLKLSKIPKQ